MARPYPRWLILCITFFWRNLAVDAADRKVATTGSDSGDCTTNACATLMYAISQSASGDSIEMEAGTYVGTGNRNLDTGGLSDLTIWSSSGRDSTIMDLESGGRFFKLTSTAGATKIQGLTLLNGACEPLDEDDRNGAGIYFETSNAIVEDVTFRNMDCSSGGVVSRSYSGGGLSLLDSTATIRNILIVDCLANHGAAVSTWGSDASTISNAVFLRNTGLRWGGALLTEEDSATLFEDVLISWSVCSYGAGLDDGGTAHPTFRNVIFEYGVGSNGMATYHFGNSYPSFENVIFRHHVGITGAVYTTANTKISMTNCTFYNNSGQEGSGIRNGYSGSSGPIIMDQVYFYDNVATDKGAAISTDIVDGALECYDCVFQRNTALFGGALFVNVLDSASQSIKFIRNVFRENVASTTGGVFHCNRDVAVTTDSGGMVFEDCIFEDNKAQNGGVLHVGGSFEVYFRNSTFRRNSAGDSGGVMHASNPMERVSLSAIEFVDTVFDSNTAVVNGGVIYCKEGNVIPTSLTFNRTTVTGSQTLLDGGALYVACSQLALEDSVFEQNSATEGSGGALLISSNVICSEDGTGSTISNTTFKNNVAALGGGLVFFDHTSPACSIPVTSEGDWDSAQAGVWYWEDYDADVIGNQATYGALQATAPSKLSTRCPEDVDWGSVACTAGGGASDDPDIVILGGYPGMELVLEATMIDDFDQQVSISGAVVEVSLANSSLPLSLDGLLRHWFSGAKASISELFLHGTLEGVAGAGDRVKLLLGIPTSLVSLSYLPSSVIELELGACPAGFIGDSQGSDYVCVACPSGQFSSDGVACQSCPSGRYAATSGQSACLACPVGYACVAGTTTPLICSAGFYQSSQGQASCDRCPMGMYQAIAGAEACSTCPAGLTTPYTGATGINECLCPEGSYKEASGSTASSASDGEDMHCAACPEGFDCPIGSDELYLMNQSAGQAPALKPGFMSLADEPFRVYACVKASQCPGGAPGTCIAFRDPGSVACGRCDEGSFESGGICTECTGSAGPAIAAFVVIVVLAIMVLAVFINRSVTEQSQSSILLIVMVSLLITWIQTLSVFTQLSIAWLDPWQSALEALAFLDFNMEVLQLGCWVGNNRLTAYVGKLLVVPIGLCLLLPALWIKQHLLKRPLVFKAEMMNMAVSVMGVCFIPVVLACMAPWTCYSHPGGEQSSMVNEPSIICFEDSAHIPFAACGIIFFLLVPVVFITIALWATRMYPDRVQACDVTFLRAFQALFFRFRPETYWYVHMTFLRSLALCLVPVVFRSAAAEQICAVLTIIVCFVIFQQSVRPWASPFANIFDGTSTLFLILLLVLGAMASPQSVEEPSLRTASVISLVVASTGVGLVCTYLVLSTLRRAIAPSSYAFFICHHKRDAAAQSRYLKTLLQQLTGQDVFLDSDDLTDLTLLFDIVKTKVNCLVVYLTPDVLRRPWCAGEIATMYESGCGKAATVRLESFVDPFPQELEDIGSFLHAHEFDLMSYGVSNNAIREGIKLLLSPTTVSIALPTSGMGVARFTSVASQLHQRFSSFQSGDKHSSGFHTNGVKAVSSMSSMKPSLPTDPGMIAISCDPGDNEALAAVGIFVSKSREKILGTTQSKICLLPDFAASPESLGQAVVRSRAVVIFLSVDTLERPEQLLVITEAVYARRPAAPEGDGPKIATLATGKEVIAEEHWSFPVVVPVTLPGFRFLSRTSITSAIELGQEQLLDSHDAGHAVVALQELIATAFSIDASDLILQAQADRIVQRMQLNKPFDVERAATLFGRTADSLPQEI